MTSTMQAATRLIDPARWPDVAAVRGSAARGQVARVLDEARVGTGSRLLEIGTGWGELAIRAAKRGATVRTVTLSARQRELALRRVAEQGVADRVTVELRERS
jgi:cyclopropane-fatty-acyl-phospholipid synthase